MLHKDSFPKVGARPHRSSHTEGLGAPDEMFLFVPKFPKLTETHKGARPSVLKLIPKNGGLLDTPQFCHFLKKGKKKQTYYLLTLPFIVSLNFVEPLSEEPMPLFGRELLWRRACARELEESPRPWMWATVESAGSYCWEIEAWNRCQQSTPIYHGRFQSVKSCSTQPMF